MLSWIPLLGPIIQGVSSIFTGYFSEKVQINATETNASVAIIQATKDDIGLRLLRDALCLFPVIWMSLVGWDTIVANHWPNLMWHTARYPVTVAYIPYAVMVFLLGNIGLNMWSRK